LLPHFHCYRETRSIVGVAVHFDKLRVGSGLNALEAIHSGLSANDNAEKPNLTRMPPQQPDRRLDAWLPKATE